MIFTCFEKKNIIIHFIIQILQKYIHIYDKINFYSGENTSLCVTHAVRVEESIENTTQQGIRRETRKRLTNSRMDDFYWSRT